MMTGTYTAISQDRLNGMLLADERRYDWLGEQNDEQGWLWSCWKDKKTGTGFCVRKAVTVHMGFNDTPQEKVDEFVRIVEEQGFCKASWGVTGRTIHMYLAQQLAERLPQYEFEIDYDSYGCLGKKKRHRRNER